MYWFKQKNVPIVIIRENRSLTKFDFAIFPGLRKNDLGIEK
jgi:hypothetical protein